MDIDAAAEAWIREFAVSTLASAETDRIAGLLNAEIAGSVPLARQDPDVRAALDASTRAQLRAFITHVLNPGTITPPPEAFVLARLIAVRGGELDALLAIYRSGQQAALHWVTGVGVESGLPGEVMARVMVVLWGHAIDWFARSVELLIGAYGEERERWLRSALTRRTQLVEALVRGDAVDVDEASQHLGHALRRHQTGLVLWLDGPHSESDPSGRLEALAFRIATAAGAARPLLVPAGPDVVWAWLATDRGMPLAPVLAGLALPEPVRVAVGTPAPGAAGFRTTHRSAVAAYELADVVAGQVLDHRELEVVSLLSRDREALRAFVARELGPLGEDDPAAARLRETVLAHFDGGPDAAATRLNVHRNTVRYRVRQAEELLGRPVGERRRELEIALLCATVLGTTRITATP
jgi:hypothetical protein